MAERAPQWRRSADDHPARRMARNDSEKAVQQLILSRPLKLKSGIKKAQAVGLPPCPRDKGHNGKLPGRYCWMRVVRSPAKLWRSIEYCQERNSSTVSM